MASAPEWQCAGVGVPDNNVDTILIRFLLGKFGFSQPSEMGEFTGQFRYTTECGRNKTVLKTLPAPGTLLLEYSHI